MERNEESIQLYSCISRIFLELRNREKGNYKKDRDCERQIDRDKERGESKKERRKCRTE